MNPARLLILLVALGAAGLAAFLIMRSEPAQQIVVQPAAPVKTVEVLISAQDLVVGKVVKPEDVRWQPWPADYAPTGSLVRSSVPGALEDVTGAIVRQSFLAGEPIRKEKLVKTDGTGFMSAILPTGMRATAITIDTRGATSAGGFILPNDHVDVLRTYRDDDASKASGGDQQMSESILKNIRVLAIGQNVQEKNGEKVVTGETATLEVTPAQAETLALAQRTGQLSLVLRSLVDNSQPEKATEERADTGLTIVRYGVGRAVGKR